MSDVEATIVIAGTVKMTLFRDGSARLENARVDYDDNGSPTIVELSEEVGSALRTPANWPQATDR